MKILFFQYPSCSTCKKAAKWLKDHDMDNPQQFTLTKILQYERTKI